MAIRINLHRTFTLSDIWSSKQDWDDVLHDLPALVELLNDDWGQVIDEAGGFAGLVVSAEWVEEAGDGGQ